MSLEEIAKKAGVSRSTVSRVINGEPYVSEKTRARVNKVIEQEQFSPNPAGRMLVTQRTRVIGIVISSSLNLVFDDPFYFPTLLRGISEVANSRDYPTLLWLGEDDDAQAFRQRILRNRLMDGLIIASATVDDPLITGLTANRMPFVMVERPADSASPISYVSVDNVQAAQAAVEHLISLGRKRIATITGPLDNVDGIDRLKGYKLALKNDGRAIEDVLISEGRFDRRSGYLAMKRLIPQGVDAVFVASDTMAMSALSAIAEAGLKVPEDISVVGFDDVYPSQQHISPQLTTIRHPIQEKGARATELLLDMLDGQIDGSRQILLPTQLVIRDTCGGLTR